MNTESFQAHVGSDNGHDPSPALTDEWQRIEQAYREIQRRDGSAERHAWQWQMLALTMVGLFICTLAVVLWQLTHARNVQAFVQVVHVDEKEQLVQVGIPQDLLTYTPPDGLWMDMLGSGCAVSGGAASIRSLHGQNGPGSTGIPVGRHDASCRRWKSGRNPFRLARSSSPSNSRVSRKPPSPRAIKSCGPKPVRTRHSPRCARGSGPGRSVWDGTGPPPWPIPSTTA